MSQAPHSAFTELQAWEVKLRELRLARRATRRSAPKYWNQKTLAADSAAACGKSVVSTNSTQEV